jgi:hypothetical protein
MFNNGTENGRKLKCELCSNLSKAISKDIFLVLWSSDDFLDKRRD